MKNIIIIDKYLFFSIIILKSFEIERIVFWYKFLIDIVIKIYMKRKKDYGKRKRWTGDTEGCDRKAS